MKTAKLFKTGGSQALRLPKAYQFTTDEVAINRVGAAVVIFPIECGWELLEQSLGEFSADYMATREQPPLMVAEGAAAYAAYEEPKMGTTALGKKKKCPFGLDEALMSGAWNETEAWARIGLGGWDDWAESVEGGVDFPYVPDLPLQEREWPW